MMQRHQTNSAMNLVNILGGIYDEDCVSLLNLPTSSGKMNVEVADIDHDWVTITHICNVVPPITEPIQRAARSLRRYCNSADIQVLTRRCSGGESGRGGLRRVVMVVAILVVKTNIIIQNFSL